MSIVKMDDKKQTLASDLYRLFHKLDIEKYIKINERGYYSVAEDKESPLGYSFWLQNADQVMAQYDDVDLPNFFSLENVVTPWSQFTRTNGVDNEGKRTSVCFLSIHF